MGVTTLSFHPCDKSAGTLVSELVPDGRSKVLPQTPGRGSLPAAGGPSPEDCLDSTPGGGGAGQMEAGHRAVSAPGTALQSRGLPAGTTLRPRCLQLGPPSTLGLSLAWGAYLSPLSVVSSRASSAPGGWGEVGTVPGRVGVWRQGQRPRAGWLLALRTRSGPAVARVPRGPDRDDLMSAWWRQRLG